MSSTGTLWGPLERRSKTVFLIAGVLLLGYAVSKGVYTFTDVTPVGAFDVAYGGLGLLVTTVGLFGLYPRLRDGAPRLSIAGVVFAGIAAIGTFALLGWLAGATLAMKGYPAIPEESPAWTVLALIVVFVTIALGFLLFGAASLRTDVFSRTVGWLLVVPGLGWIGLIVGNVALPSGQYLGLVYVPISVALLSVGYLFQTGSARTDRVESASDSVA
jgi:hypothetical protein